MTLTFSVVGEYACITFKFTKPSHRDEILSLITTAMTSFTKSAPGHADMVFTSYIDVDKLTKDGKLQ